jgi:hypothetical protein
VQLTWYVGLDAEATRLGDALWAGEPLDDVAKRRLVGLYQLNLAKFADRDEKPDPAPIYLILAMSAQMTLFLKPQNLLTGLPLGQLETVQ